MISCERAAASAGHLRLETELRWERSCGRGEERHSDTAGEVERGKTWKKTRLENKYTAKDCFLKSNNGESKSFKELKKQNQK